MAHGDKGGFVIKSDGSWDWAPTRPPHVPINMWTPFDQASPDLQAAVDPEYIERVTHTPILNRPGDQVPGTLGGPGQSGPTDLSGVIPGTNTFGGNPNSFGLTTNDDFGWPDQSTAQRVADIIGRSFKFVWENKEIALLLLKAFTDAGRDTEADARINQGVELTLEDRARFHALSAQVAGIEFSPSDLSAVFADPSNPFNVSAVPSLDPTVADPQDPLIHQPFTPVGPAQGGNEPLDRLVRRRF